MIGFVGSGGWPESLVRVQNITKKSLKFYDVDVWDRSSLRQVFEKVNKTLLKFLLLYSFNS